MRLKTILAQQKGNIVRDHVFTVGDRTLQAIDRKIEDYQFEPRRFFFTIDPRLLGSAYPNVDILDTRRMAALSASLPDTLRPTKIFLYRLLIGGQPPNPSGPQFRLLGNPRSRRGQVYEYLREGVDYYADPSLLWIALVRPPRPQQRATRRSVSRSHQRPRHDLHRNGRYAGSLLHACARAIRESDLGSRRATRRSGVRSRDQKRVSARRPRPAPTERHAQDRDRKQRGSGETGRRYRRHLSQAFRTRAEYKQLELRSRESHLASAERSELRAEPGLARLAHDPRPVSDISLPRSRLPRTGLRLPEIRPTTPFTLRRRNTYVRRSDPKRSTTSARAIKPKEVVREEL